MAKRPFKIIPKTDTPEMWERAKRVEEIMIARWNEIMSDVIADICGPSRSTADNEGLSGIFKDQPDGSVERLIESEVALHGRTPPPNQSQTPPDARADGE